MEVERTAVDSAKRIVDLEAEVDKLTGQNFKLEREVMEVRGEEERMKEMHAKGNGKYVKLKDRFCSQESKWKEEKGVLRDKFWEAELGKRKLEIGLEVATKRLEDRGGVANSEARLLLSLVEGEVSEFVEKIEALEKEKGERDAEICKLKSRLEMVDEVNRAREAESRRVEEERVSGLVQKIYVLEKDKGDRDAEILELKSGLEMDCRVRKGDDQRVEAETSEFVEKIAALEREKGDRDAEICKLRSGLEMGDQAIRAREAKCWRVEERILELVQKIEVLEKDKGNRDAEICKLTRRLEMENQVKRGREVENQRVEKKISKLVEKILDLEKEKGERDDDIRKLKMINSIEAERIVEVNNVLEAEKKRTGNARKTISELTEKLAVLKAVEEARESEKRAMEDEHKGKVEACQAKTEKIEDIKRILNEKTTLELVSRVYILEREKRGLEAETRKKDEVIKTLVQKNQCSAADKHILEMETNKCTSANSEEDVELSHEVHPVSNVGIFGTPTAHNQGRKSVDVSITESSTESLDSDLQLRGHDGQVLSSEHQKRKVEALGRSVESQVGTKRCKMELAWTSPQDMFNALTTNDELCMRSVCALYRKHKSLGHWKEDCWTCGLTTPFEIRVKVFGELLTSGDPEGRLKKSIDEFEQVDPCGLENCRLIARHHYMELFEIYTKNLDPLFISGDDMS